MERCVVVVYHGAFSWLRRDPTDGVTTIFVNTPVMVDVYIHAIIESGQFHDYIWCRLKTVGEDELESIRQPRSPLFHFIRTSLVLPG